MAGYYLASNVKSYELTANDLLVSLASYIDPTHARPQPERPTHVVFPQQTDLESHPNGEWRADAEKPTFSRQYALLKKPSDLTSRHLQDLNITIAPHTPPGDLIPRDSQGRSYLPIAEDNADANLLSKLASATQANQTALQYRLTELRYDNDICYRTVCRAPLPEGREKIRLANLRNFFAALEGMSEHWDTGGEAYFVEGPAGDIEDDGSLNGHSVMAAIATTTENAIMDKKTESVEPTDPSVSGLIVPQQDDGKNNLFVGIRSSFSSNSDSDDEIPMPLYRGRRISCGSKMPWLYRAETVKGLLEAAAFSFGCRVSQPRQLVTLQWCDVRLPLRYQTFLVHRVPGARAEARSGIVEGPLMACYVRTEFEAFGEGSETQKQEKARLDLLKEIGSLLHVAQERRREGKREKLWVKKSPKNGHWFSEMASDGAEPQQDPAAGAQSVGDFTWEVKADSRKAKKSKTKYSVWKEMNPQKPSWDPKMRYMAIGKDKEGEWDEVGEAL